MLGEIGEIPVLFKSMIPSELSFALDFSSAGSFSIITFHCFLLRHSLCWVHYVTFLKTI